MPNKKCPICKKGELLTDHEKTYCSNCPFKYSHNKKVKRSKWAKGKSWVFPSLVLAFLLYTASRYILDFDYPIARYENPLSFADLGIHEVGHLLFGFTGRFFSILGGSLFQIIVPIIAIIGLRRERHYFASSAAFIWLGLNLYDVAAYAADATARILPLVTIGGGGDYESSHDWYQLLSRLDILEADNEIAFTLRVLGFIFIALGTHLSLKLILKIRATR